MNQIFCEFTGDDPTVQKEAVDLLARCFEVWAERKITFKGKFPFREFSFVARNQAGQVVGHLGIIPFEVKNRTGKMIKMAGVASVAVAPECRKCGIAGMLCQSAAAWAEKNNFDAMPLYTSACRVYEKNGWQLTGSGARFLQSPDHDSNNGNWKSSDRLSDAEKEFIIKCYDSAPTLTGQVVRTMDAYDAMSWQRLFSKAGFRWQLSDNGYILSVDNVICECCNFPTIPPGIDQAFLSRHDVECQKFLDAKWSTPDMMGNLPPCWDGETVMIKLLPGKSLPEDIFYPLAHKF